MMSDDLTERLRNHAAFERNNPRRAMSGISAHDWDQAADRIDKLETDRQNLINTLQQWHTHSEWGETPWHPQWCDDMGGGSPCACGRDPFCWEDDARKIDGADE